MASIAGPIQIRGLIWGVVCAIACIAQTALAGILISLTTVPFDQVTLHAQALASAVLNCLVLIALVATTVWVLSTARASRSGPSASPRHYLPQFLLSCFILTTTILTIYVLAGSWTSAKYSISDLGFQHPASVIAAGIAMWLTSLLSESALLFAVSSRTIQPRGSTASSETTEGSSPPSSKRPFSLSMRSFAAADSPFQRHSVEPYSPSLSSVQTPRSSIRDSLNQVLGPIGSKTKLLLPGSIYSRDSQSQLSRREPSLEIACRGDGFETWDTSAVEEHYMNHFPNRINSGRAKLDPIPGSRPASPARPLDGPFPANPEPEDMPLPDSPKLGRARSPLLTAPRSPLTDRNVSGITFPPIARIEADEARIHPLFRSGSPVPPPAPSPGTIVTASPHAGQVVSLENVVVPKRFRSAQNSQATTPNLSPVGSFSGSYFGVSPTAFNSDSRLDAMGKSSLRDR